jgi:pimeloyl-ACP methyl ester carboxylesterase
MYCEAASMKRLHHRWVLFQAILLVVPTIAGFIQVLFGEARSQSPTQQEEAAPRRLPPPGVAIPEGDHAELTRSLAELDQDIEQLEKAIKGKPALLDLLPDVLIFREAVRVALHHDEFHDVKEVAIARKQLAQGRERAKQLAEGTSPWTTATGLVVRGYRSRVDDSIQPYGLVVPASYRPDTPHRFRLDVWFHGRNEKLSELRFLDDRQKSPGQFTPANAFVLHPYGRYCNANKFAGETDTFEALAHVQRHYPIDENRLVVRGFSMGGAACWHMAVHHADRWAAAAPGAGFSETPRYLRIHDEKPAPTWYHETLWRLYNCTDVAANLYHCPVVAYSGEKDRQKQAADVMAQAMAEEGMKLVHVIGPDTEHKYHPKAKEEIDRRIDALAARGRDGLSRKVVFTTWTLRYPRMHWVHLDGLEKHWERARVDAEIEGDAAVRVKTKNVSAMTLEFSPAACPLDVRRKPKVVIDDAEVEGDAVLSDRSWTTHLRKVEGKWQRVDERDDGTLRKRPGLQGPIDDAFFDRFVMVKSTGKPAHEAVGRWVNDEFAYAVSQWRAVFRGDAIVRNDDAVSERDIADSHLVLWGDPSSNAVLGRIADKLPIRWDGKSLKAAGKTFDAAHHLPVLVYPNPLNPKRYVVLNSGFTFRESDYSSNARMVPKLPDYAVLDVRIPTVSREPSPVVLAGFFDETWRFAEKR